MRTYDSSARSNYDASGTPVGDDPAIRHRIRQFIRDSFLVDEFTDNASFLGTGLIDSLGVLQLVSFVESEFEVSVPDTDLTPANFDSVAKLAAYVDRRNREKAAA